MVNNTDTYFGLAPARQYGESFPAYRNRRRQNNLAVKQHLRGTLFVTGRTFTYQTDYGVSRTKARCMDGRISGSRCA